MPGGCACVVAALASGAAALVSALNPSFGPDQLRQQLTSTSADINQLNPEHHGLLGAGRLDVVEAAAGAPSPGLPGDLNNDGVVNVFDLLMLLASWGSCPADGACPADLNGDSNVDVFDLLLLLANWG